MPPGRDPSDGEPQLDLFGGAAPAAPRTRAVAPVAPAPDLAALAMRLPPGVRLGTSSWSFPGWAGIVYAGAHTTEALAREGLAAYARHPLLRAVGIDRTYYAPIEARAFARYAEAVPDDFRFLVKAHDVCTLPVYSRSARHAARAGERNPRYLDPAYATDAVVGPCAAGLGAKLGTILFQFAPLGAEVTLDPPAFAARLERFLSALPRGPLYAVELRSKALLVPDYVKALVAAQAVHCLNAHPSMPSIRRQHRLVSEVAGAALRSVVARWMLPLDLRYEEARERYRPFDRIVAEDRPTRHALASFVRAAAAEGRESTIVINNKAEGSAPLSAFRLAEAIAARDEGDVA